MDLLYHYPGKIVGAIFNLKFKFTVNFKINETLLIYNEWNFRNANIFFSLTYMYGEERVNFLSIISVSTCRLNKTNFSMLKHKQKQKVTILFL